MIICDICTPLKPLVVWPSAFYLKISSLWIISPLKSATISVTMSDFSPFLIPCMANGTINTKKLRWWLICHQNMSLVIWGLRKGFFCFTSWSLWSSDFRGHFRDYLEGTLSLWEKCCRNQLEQHAQEWAGLQKSPASSVCDSTGRPLPVPSSLQRCVCIGCAHKYVLTVRGN